MDFYYKLSLALYFRWKYILRIIIIAIIVMTFPSLEKESLFGDNG